MSSYGNTTELWFVAMRGNELKYPAAAFTSLYAAQEHAKKEMAKYDDAAIYEAKLSIMLVSQEPRVVDMKLLSEKEKETPSE